MALEKQIEDSFIRYLSENLKYVYRDDIHDRASLEQNFREKFQNLNRCHLTDNEFARLLEEITDSDVFNTSKRLRERNTFIREDGTPLQYMLVNMAILPRMAPIRTLPRPLLAVVIQGLRVILIAAAHIYALAAQCIVLVIRISHITFIAILAKIPALRILGVNTSKRTKLAIGSLNN